jgi:hypothetical protein
MSKIAASSCRGGRTSKDSSTEDGIEGSDKGEDVGESQEVDGDSRMVGLTGAVSELAGRPADVEHGAEAGSSERGEVRCSTREPSF